jgi:hypothetical protein
MRRCLLATNEAGQSSWNGRQGSNKRRPTAPAKTPLLLLRPSPADALDRQRGAAGFFGDLAVLLHDEAARGFVAVQAAEQLGGHAAVGALRAVFIDDIEKGEFAFRIGPGFLGHGGLVSDLRNAVKEKRQGKSRTFQLC